MAASSRLFWRRRSDAGFQIRSCIAASTLPGAGDGRFTLEPLSSGQLVRRSRMLPFTDCLAAGGADGQGENIVLLLRDQEELEALIFYLAAAREETPAEIARHLSWFVAGTGGIAYINSVSAYFNHNIPANLLHRLDGPWMDLIASREIAPGEELFTDYNHNDIAPFFRHWCAEAGLTDAQTFPRALSRTSEI